MFVVTKVGSSNLAPDAMRRACDASLKALACGYIDLYLIHWPTAAMDLPATLAAMRKLREQGLSPRVGVSNFTVALMRQAVEEIGAPVACNQVEYHVLLGQSRVLDYARAKGIAVAAYCPLARGGLGRVRDSRPLPQARRLAGAGGLEWLLDQDMVAAIPKSSREATQRENLAALDITLDDDDRRAIAALPKDRRLVDMHTGVTWDPPG